jgi:hypothetical protein
MVPYQSLLVSTKLLPIASVKIWLSLSCIPIHGLPSVKMDWVPSQFNNLNTDESNKNFLEFWHLNYSTSKTTQPPSVSASTFGGLGSFSKSIINLPLHYCFCAELREGHVLLKMAIWHLLCEKEKFQKKLTKFWNLSFFTKRVGSC